MSIIIFIFMIILFVVFILAITPIISLVNNYGINVQNFKNIKINKTLWLFKEFNWGLKSHKTKPKQIEIILPMFILYILGLIFASSIILVSIVLSIFSKIERTHIEIVNGLILIFYMLICAITIITTSFISKKRDQKSIGK